MLALSGGLEDEQPNRYPCRAFHWMGQSGYSSHVIATCQAAWRASRNPMALLLPLVWRRWMQGSGYPVRNDSIPPMEMIRDVPAYAIDQFTRIGLQALRSYVSADRELRDLLDQGRIPAGQRIRAVGDLLFLVEGSSLAQRVV